jgi:hypothetical protein
MSSSSTMRNYKHDITGKFKDITTALNAMGDDAFDDPENNEIFHAIHEVLLKMVKTSRNTILENSKQEIVLVVSDQEPATSLPKLQIEGVVVRYEMKKREMNYYLFLNENPGNYLFLIAKVHSALPFNILRKDLRTNELNKNVEEVNSSLGL